MRDRDILKLKLGLAIISIAFLLTASKTLFDYWTSIHWTIWLITLVIIYRGVYLTLKLLAGKDEQITFKGFATIGTITSVIIIALATMMLFIFYPLVSILFYGLTFISLSVFGGLEFK